MAGDALDQSLLGGEHLPPGKKAGILGQLFHITSSNLRLDGYLDYFEFYEAELQRLQSGLSAASRPSFQLAANSHSDLLFIATLLSEHRGSTRPQIRQKIQSRFPGLEDSSLNRSIDLTLRLWLTLNVREDMILTESQSRKWDDNRILETFISDQFPISTLSQESRETRLHPQFTVANMISICGLKIGWTHCLANHLRLDRKSNKLWIYPYKNLLVAHQGPNSKSILPKSLVHETILSLNLLFPDDDLKTQKLLRSEKQDFHRIPPFDGPGSLSVREFDYWTDRILELYADVYQAPATTWRQILRDQRNPQQWCTFWLALAIAVLTLVATAATIVQAWAAVYALRLQIESLRSPPKS